jgi:DNA-binding CsgD family transcriptional regulator
MFERDTQRATAVINRGDCTDVFIFVGGGFVFPNSILRMTEQEAGGVHALRVDSLRDMRGLARDPQWAIRKVFFDDRVAPEVLRDFDLWRVDLPKADWILAYRDADVARNLLDARAQRAALAPILLLPMTLPICPWTSMLRLVLGGQFIAAGDLVSPGPAGEGAAGRLPVGLAPVSDNDVPSRIPSDPGASDAGLADHGPSDHGLTRREKEVLALVSQGGRNKTIAHAMSLSEHTVKLHLHNAITKIGARNRTEAATWYLSQSMGEGR